MTGQVAGKQRAAEVRAAAMLEYLAVVEPQLRATATIELDARAPIDKVVE
jgi:hypothetical protein